MTNLEKHRNLPSRINCFLLNIKLYSHTHIQLKKLNMKTKLQLKFEKQTPSIYRKSGIEYLRVYCAWLELQLEKELNKNYES